MSIEEFERLVEREMNDVTDHRGYWAGRIAELGIIETENETSFSGRVKVQITWVTDRTHYRCHKIYEMRQEDVKDFTHRSIMLRRCK